VVDGMNEIAPRSTVTATHGMVARHNARAQREQMSAAGLEARCARTRFSNASGTWSPGGLARAAASSFFLSSSVFIRQQLFQTAVVGLGLQILVLRDSLQNLLHLATRAEGADFDERHRPAREFSDLFDAAIFYLQQCDDKPASG